MAHAWLTTNQAAGLTGYRPRHIRQLIITGKVKARKFGDVWQVSKSSLLAYWNKAKQGGAKRGPKVVT